MLATYAPVFILLLVAVSVASLFFIGSTYLGGKLEPKSPETMLPFECGSDSSGGRHIKLSVKFYLTAILFVVFDIEVVFIYPWALHFKQLGWFGMASMFGFLSVIVVGLVYCWRKGALEWET